MIREFNITDKSLLEQCESCGIEFPMNPAMRLYAEEHLMPVCCSKDCLGDLQRNKND